MSFINILFFIYVGLIVGIFEVQANWEGDRLSMGQYFDRFIKTLSNCENTGKPTLEDMKAANGISSNFTNSYAKTTDLEEFIALAAGAFDFFSDKLNGLKKDRKKDLRDAAIRLCQQINTYSSEAYHGDNMPLKGAVKQIYTLKGDGKGDTFDKESLKTLQR